LPERRSVWTWDQVWKKRRPRKCRYSSSVAPSNSMATWWMKFFIVSVATTCELSPSVYAGARLWSSTWTSASYAKRMFDRPTNDDSGIGASPASGFA
jgi:hypothetical protein